MAGKWIQKVTPNTDDNTLYVYADGGVLYDWFCWCLAVTDAAFGVPAFAASAQLGWNQNTTKHTDYNLPIGVFVPIWWTGDAQGYGHVAIALRTEENHVKIWSSPYTHKAYFDYFEGPLHGTINKIGEIYTTKAFLGWTETLGNTRIVEWVNTAPTITWEKYEKPQNFKLKLQPTNLWFVGTSDPSEVYSVSKYDQGAEFEAYGRFYHKEFNAYYLAGKQSTERQEAIGINQVDAEKIIQVQVVETPETPLESPETGNNEPSSPSTPETNIEERPDSSSVVEQEGETTPQTSIEEKWDKTLEKSKKSLSVFKRIAKKFNIRIPMPNKLYDFLKLVALILLPLSALYVGLAPIWGWGFGNEVDQTIRLVISAIDTILGLALVKSSSDYKKGNK